MNRDEVIDLLTLAASYDRRTVGEADIAAWLLAVGDLPAGDTQAAMVAYYQDSREWVMPADIRQRVRAIRAERVADTPLPEPPREVADDPAAYQAWLAGERRQIADGPREIPAIEAS